MNLKNLTLALIGVLIYELVLKLSHHFVPSFFELAPVAAITSIIFFISGIIIILFMICFYQAERTHQTIKLACQIIIAGMVLNFILRLPLMQNRIDLQVIRMVREVIGCLNAMFLFILVVAYRQSLPDRAKSLKQAAGVLAILFGFGIIKTLLAAIYYSRFVVTGVTRDVSPWVNYFWLILFLVTHLSLIYFLYWYYRFKFEAS
ncbi:hypothetical protein L0128_11870 [candidate division KSB1 bacterium]|nr:hypothetical protein [candidate division KSB1 bacterium]